MEHGGLGQAVFHVYYTGGEMQADGVGVAVTQTSHANSPRQGTGVVEDQDIQSPFDHRERRGRSRVAVRLRVGAAPMRDDHVLGGVAGGVMHAEPIAPQRGAQCLRLQLLNQRRIDDTDAILVENSARGGRSGIGADGCIRHR